LPPEQARKAAAAVPAAGPTGRFGFLGHALLEAFDAFAEIAHHLGNPAATEQDEDHQRENDQMRKGQAAHG